MMDTITSRTNQTVRLVASLLKRRSVRERDQLFVAEGLRAIDGLLEHGCRMEYLLIDVGRCDEVPESIRNAADQQDARSLAVDSAIFNELSDVEAPQSVIGIFQIPRQPLPRYPKNIVALDGIQDPGNLGSILRSCRAAGVDGVLVLRGTVDPYSPKVVRATAGLFASLPLAMLASVDEIHLQEWEVPGQVVIADGSASTLHTEYDWTLPHILVLGSEASGTRHQWQSMTPAGVRIDMEPGVESLNVAAAAAVVLFEIRRQCALI